MNIFLNKKAIGPVVAVALLLVVSVAAVMGFQTWFQTYQSGVNSKVEIQSNTNLGNIKIETLIGNTLYFNNGGTNNITINSVKIGGIDCNISKNISTGMKSLNVTNCLNNLTTSTPDILVFTNKGVYQSSVYIKSVTSSTQSISASTINCSSLNGGSWIKVPGNSALGTSDFCVMKYEAKCLEQTNGQSCLVGNTLVSQPSNTPWVNINQTDARLKCSNLGTGYHLITDTEWVTVAREAENNPSNWNSSVVGSGYVYSGHNDNAPANALAASTIDSNGYYNETNIGGNQRRTLNISGNIIWDLAGNVWEWENNTISANGGGNFGKSGWNYYEWTTIVTPLNYGPSNSSFNSVQKIGQLYIGGEVGTTIYGFLRGGYWFFGVHTGAFALNLYYSPSNLDTYDGFRCSYTG